MDDMRLFLPVVALLLAAPALAQPNQPRDPASKDGLFTICAFQKFDQCDLLSEPSIQKFNFSAAEKRTLQELRRHAEAPLIKLTDLEKSFGKPSGRASEQEPTGREDHRLVPKSAKRQQGEMPRMRGLSLRDPRSPDGHQLHGGRQILAKLEPRRAAQNPAMKSLLARWRRDAVTATAPDTPACRGSFGRAVP